MRKVIILGSSRKDGATKKVASKLIQLTDWDLINITDYDISHYDYEHLNKDDDFIPLISEIIEEYDVFIFATPVYWYAMSGVMKMFFDRFTDLLSIEKDIGRKLRSKSMAVISSSTGENLQEQFWLPFKKTAEYLGIRYITDLHTIQDKLNKKELLEFIQLIENKG